MSRISYGLPLVGPLLLAATSALAVLVEKPVLNDSSLSGLQKNGELISEIIFIDSSVNSLESLVHDRPHTDVVVLDADRDGVKQIGEVLSNRKEIDAIHILSHGKPGAIFLGGSEVTEEVLKSEYAKEIELIANSLSDDADILIYGCRYGAEEEGVSAVKTLARLTGADVAASVNDTGAVLFGGDWVLERASNTIETVALSLTQFQGVLVDTDGDSIDDSDDYDDDNDGITDSTEGVSVDVQLPTLAEIINATDDLNSGAMQSTMIFNTIGVNPTISAIVTHQTGDNFYREHDPGSNDFDIEINNFPVTAPTASYIDMVPRSFSGADPIDRTLNIDFGASADSISNGEYTYQYIIGLAGLGADGWLSGNVPNRVLTITSDAQLTVAGFMDIFEPGIVAFPDLNGVQANQVGASGTIVTTNNAASNGLSTDYVYFTIESSISSFTLDFDGDDWHGFTLGVIATRMIDTDDDGIADFLDLDSDNDGISDLYESGVIAANLALDANADGTLGVGELTDTDSDGLDDTFAPGTTPVNTDADALADYLDLDSDADGIADTVESRLTLGYVNHDGFTTNVDSDGDGVLDIFDSNVGFGADAPNFNAPNIHAGDTADSLPDYIDTDSDGDGLDDINESGAIVTSPTYADPDGSISDPGSDLDNEVGDATETGFREITDTDGDGVANNLDLDDDNDGIPDTVEGVADTDSDGIADSLDLDSDNDGITDTAEAGGADADGDGDGDGEVDGFADANDDGLDDATATTPLPIFNTDGDSVPDYKDLDSDNDGLSDALEAGATDANGDGIVDGFTDTDSDGLDDTIASTPLSMPDSDNDLTADYLDVDSDDDGLTDAEEAGGTDADADGEVDGFTDTDGNGFDDAIEAAPLANPDTDSDGDADVLDTDSDNDGIDDSEEVDGDSDGDGIPNSKDIDSDNDGIPDVIEGDTDTDNDTTPDYLDADSDNDGLTDTVEAGGVDADGDGVIDGFTDANSDGLDDTVAATPLAVPDTDGDLTPDYLDVDSDDDGLSDAVEAGATDIDADGEVDGFADTDGNGLDDALEANPLSVPDTDRDGIPNNRDQDSDNDGIPDRIEDDVDTDGDGIQDYQDLDSDNDGLADIIEAGGIDADADGMVDSFADVNNDGLNDGLAAVPLAVPDTDGDGATDYLDTDSDNDGLSDLFEAGGIDADADGMVDSFTDADGNGVDDALETAPLANSDTDGDGVPDHRDIDSDDDGIPDIVEGSVDTDGDLTPDYKDVDSDNDGVDDDIEDTTTPELSGNDADLDGIDDALDADFTGGVDADGNGIEDSKEPTDSDGDGIPDNLDIDSDSDGIPDVVEGALDSDADGIPDTLEGTRDTDGDGLPDYLDIDSDNDGILDDVEDNLTPSLTGDDTDADGIDDAIDVDVTGGDDIDGNGVDDAFQPTDTDGDSLPDHLDTDSDNDGIPDIVEGMADTDGDLTPDYQDVDSDNDGIDDNAEDTTTPAISGFDADLDGIDDVLDVDATSGDDVNGNGIDDALEPTDSDGDGVPDNLDIDSDDDGIPDVYETAIDTDDDGTPDYLDIDSDNDGVNDDVEDSLTPPMIGVDSDADGIDNALDVDSTGGVDENGNGIDDALEPVDSDNDGVPDHIDIDRDNDGIPDSVEGSDDTDGDGISNQLDTDSDDDRIPDIVEGTLDTDNDSVPDYLDLDSDNDGIVDATEGDGDTDDDGVPDYRDEDSDNDGVSDTIEANFNGELPADVDRDGVFDYLDVDADNDGISDSEETSSDSDGDGVSNFRDLDVDNDGIFDIVESRLGMSEVNQIDTNLDGVIDATFVFGPNGMADLVETSPESGDENYAIQDVDNDGVQDYRDLDSDNDGFLDTLESDHTDIDFNGIIDALGTNGLFLLADGNTSGAHTTGLREGAGGVPRNTDEDDLADFRDLDSDNDGISDVVEVLDEAADLDGDGYLDDFVDTDQNGLNDNYGRVSRTPIDTDRDGLPDVIELDSDGDGISDLTENGMLDENNDGLIDGFVDTNRDGRDDGVSAFPPALEDTDNDGEPNYRDLDSDNDGLFDVIEGGGVDIDGDGISDIPQLSGALPDTDANEVADVLEPSGSIKAGLSGSGCSIGRPQTFSDPTFLLLMFGACLFLVMRRRKTLALTFEVSVEYLKKSGWIALIVSSSACSVLSDKASLRTSKVSDQDSTQTSDVKDSANKFSRNLYIAAGLGVSSLEPDTSERPAVSVTDKLNTGGQLALGVDLNKQFSFELHSSDLGSAGLSIGRLNYHINAGSLLLYAGKNRHRIKRRGLSAYGRLGYGAMENSAVGNFSYETVNSNHVLYGVGVEYGFRRGLGVRADIISFDSDASYMQLGLIYRIGLQRGAKKSPVKPFAPDTEIESIPALDTEKVPVVVVTDAESLKDSGVPDSAIVSDHNCKTYGGASVVGEGDCPLISRLAESINFLNGSSELTDESRLVLDKVVDALRLNDSIAITIAAHTDDQGAVASNQRLSEARAKSVARYLIGRGIDKNRLDARAYGETRPITSNDTADGRGRNRRVEIQSIAQ